MVQVYGNGESFGWCIDVACVDLRIIITVITD